MNVKDLPYVTRILIPQKRADALHRGRLIDFLHEQVERRLILISAAAGYGKTTLLVDFVHDVQAAVCWYSLAEADKDPKVFLEYLVASIRQRFPGFGGKTLTLLDSVTDLSKDLSSVVGILVNEIHDFIPEYFFIVLDDYHHVDDSPRVNEALDLLLYYLPSNCHIILSSRSLPRLTLSRLAAQRVVAGLGASDLRFTVQEIRDFLRTSFKVLLPESLAQELASSSEGWITGIVLSTFHLGQGMLESFMRARNSGGPVFDFLATEVFNQESASVQSFLLESSILQQFNSQRCAEVLGIANAHEMLRTIEERNLFVTRTENSDWYRYHNLFAEFLQSKLKQEHPERYVELNTLAGAVCYERGEVEDAVQHYARARRHDKAVEIIEAVGENLLDAGKLQTIERWLVVVPPELVASNPVLAMFQGRLSQVGNLDKALESFNRAMGLFEQRGDSTSAARALAKRSTVRRLMGLTQESVEDCLRLLDMARDDDEAEAEARKGIGIVRGMEGKFNESIIELRRSLTILESRGSTYKMAELNHALGTANYLKGDLSSALGYYQNSLSLWEKVGNLGYAAEILNSMAMTSYLRGQFEGALSTLREALTKARASGYLRIEAHIWDSLGIVAQDMDDMEEALRAYENGLDLARRVNEIPLITHLLTEIGGIYRLRGDLARAERLIRQGFAQAQEYGGRKEASLGEMSLGLLALDRGNLKQAATYLSKACKGLKAAGGQMELAKAHYHLANIFLLQQRDDEAEKQLRVVDQIVTALHHDAFMAPQIRHAPRPAEFAVAKGIGVGWMGRIKPGEMPVAVPTEAHELVVETPRESLLSVRVCTLGQNKVTCGGRELTDSDWSTQITKELFFYLISQPRGARREEVMEALWPELSLAKANSSFHVAMYRLRRATFSELFVHQGGRYLLNPGADVWYDVEEFEGSVNKALNCGANSDDAIPHWEKAASLYEGAFLPQFYTEWCEAKRRGLEERYLQAQGALARYYFKKGDFSTSISHYDRVLAGDPYDEEVHRQLIKAHALAGDRPAAIRRYNRLVQMLQEELGTEPSRETVAVYNSLLSGTTDTSTEKKGKDQRSGRRG